MADYRLYCLDRNGHINLAEWIEADSDDVALRLAREVKHGARRCEIWDERRLVAKLNAEGDFELIDR